MNKDKVIRRIAGIIICITGIWLGCNSNTAGSSQSPSTKPLEIIAPAGGEAFHVGEMVTVQWRINDASKIASVAIELSIDNGKSFPMLLADGSFPPEITAFEWTVEKHQVSAGCQIRVYEYDTKSINDKSGKFSISD